MSNMFQTEYGTMDAAKGHVLQVNSEIQTALSSLMSRLEPLASAWLGGAATSFQQVKTNWNANARQLNDALRGIAELLGQARVTYSTTDEQEQSSFNRLNQPIQTPGLNL